MIDTQNFVAKNYGYVTIGGKDKHCLTLSQIVKDGENERRVNVYIMNIELEECIRNLSRMLTRVEKSRTKSGLYYSIENYNFSFLFLADCVGHEIAIDKNNAYVLLTEIERLYL